MSGAYDLIVRNLMLPTRYLRPCNGASLRIQHLPTNETGTPGSSYGRHLTTRWNGPGMQRDEQEII